MPMTRSDRLLPVTQMRSRERRRAILLAATHVFGEKGVTRARMADIARRAGVPLSSIYDYFRNKEHLLYEVPRANFEELYAEADDALAGMTSCAERIRGLYGMTLLYVERNPAWGRVFFLEIWPSPLVGQAAVREAIDAYAQRFILLFREGQAAGEFEPKRDPYLLADIFLGAMCQVVATWLLYQRPRSLSAAAGPLLDSLMCTALPATAGGPMAKNR